MGKIVSWLLSGALGPLIQGGLQAYTIKLQASGQHDAKVVELAARQMVLDGQEARLNADRKRDILGHWYAPENLFAYFIAFPYWFKAITVDNVIGSIWEFGWSTPALKGETAAIMAMIMTFWFGKRTINTVAKVIADAFGKH